jgi:hypothetical protein
MANCTPYPIRRQLKKCDVLHRFPLAIVIHDSGRELGAARRASGRSVEAGNQRANHCPRRNIRVKCRRFLRPPFMSDQLEPHALAALFPQISDDELQALADDIRRNEQREPVLTYEGKVLDGWNRVRACRLIGRKPWVMGCVGVGDQAGNRCPEESAGPRSQC